jgi:hypothetical protein
MMMGREFESFSDLRGQLTTSRGVPYNELFSTEEIRRLTFTRFLAMRNQELSPLLAKEQASALPAPVDDFLMATDTLMRNWLLLGLKLFCSPSLTLVALMTDYSQLPFRCLRFWEYALFSGKVAFSPVTKKVVPIQKTGNTRKRL